MVDDDYMQVGTIVPLGEGWFLDTETERKFKYNEDGYPIFEDEMDDSDKYDINDEEDHE